MFWHNFKYTFKRLIRNKTLLFWNVMFPLILGTFFYFAFADIISNETLSPISIGIVDNQNYQENEMLQEVFSDFSDETGSNHIFNITYESKSSLDKLLADGEIDGYVFIEDNIQVVIKENGINQTILKYTVDNILEYESLIDSIIASQVQKGNYDVQAIYSAIMNDLNQDESYIIDKSSTKLDYMTIEFYTLIAMTCLYGANLSSFVISSYQANLGKQGARVSLSIARKYQLIGGGILACFIAQVVTLSILFAYTTLLFKVDYGSNLINIIILTLAGILAGIALGTLAGAMSFKTENARDGVLTSLTMAGSFLAGMMGVTMKYVIDKNFPLINKVNPVAQITDGFYSLYYYETTSRFNMNVISLLIFTVVMVALATALLRRKNYDSI